MTKKLSILAPTRYPWRFNSPRHSTHDISVRKFLPMNRFSYKLEGITVFYPFPLKRFDLIHTFNRVPLSKLPFVMGFESHMPRAYSLEHTLYYKALTNRLAGNKCRRIVAISEYARKLFLQQHANSPQLPALISKLEVRYPNVDLPTGSDMFSAAVNDPIRLVFVGNHFGRKGGCAIVRLAELAKAQGLALEIDLVSGLETGIASWVDPLSPDYFTSWRARLAALPNIRHRQHVPNTELLGLVSRAHFLMLPTFADTFGFSVIEAMAHHTPVITTHQGAMPEVIRDGENSILLPLECNDNGDWIHIKRHDRDGAAYEKLFTDENERLAQEALQRITTTLSGGRYANMRKGARQTAEQFFDAKTASHYWDALYQEAIK